MKAISQSASERPQSELLTVLITLPYLSDYYVFDIESKNFYTKTLDYTHLVDPRLNVLS